MKTARKILLAMMLVVTLMSFSVVAHAVDNEDAITIDSMTFSEYEGEGGVVDESLISVKVGFTAVYPSEQITILVSTDDITELTDSNVGKVTYIDQVDKPGTGELDFVIEKARVAEAIGLQTINGTTLYVKMGGTDIETMAEKEFTLVDPAVSNIMPGDVNSDKRVNAVDGTLALRYLAGWPMANLNTDALDVNDDKRVNAVDGTLLLRYLAGWPIELK